MIPTYPFQSFVFYTEDISKQKNLDIKIHLLS